MACKDTPGGQTGMPLFLGGHPVGDVEHRTHDEVVLATRYALNRLSSDVLRRNAAGVDPLPQLVDDVLMLGRTIRTAIADNAFNLVFQPIVDLADGRITHHEALIRFNDDQSPEPAVLLAEELGFGSELDRAVIGRAIDLLARAEPHLPVLAVNLSGYSIADTVFVDDLMALLCRSRIESKRLMFEVTESAAVRSLPRLDSGISRLRRLGFATGLDDFGAGTASLDRLRRLDVDFIKLDRALVSRLGSNPRDEALLRGICQACLEMGVRVIGEGIETDRQATALRALGVHGAQGWRFGRPAARPAAGVADDRTVEENGFSDEAPGIMASDDENRQIS